MCVYVCVCMCVCVYTYIHTYIIYTIYIYINTRTYYVHLCANVFDTIIGTKYFIIIVSVYYYNLLKLWGQRLANWGHAYIYSMYSPYFYILDFQLIENFADGHRHLIQNNHQNLTDILNLCSLFSNILCQFTHSSETL